MQSRELNTRQTDGRMDGRTDRHTNRQTDRHNPTLNGSMVVLIYTFASYRKKHA